MMAGKRHTASAIPSGDQRATGGPTPRVRARLDTIAGVLHELGRLYRGARSGAITPGHATKLAYILATMARIQADSVLEQRIAALERGARHGNV